MADNRVYQLKEITEGFPQNHYYLRGGKLIAFYPANEPELFKIYDKPFFFDKRYRQFETIAVTNGL